MPASTIDRRKAFRRQSSRVVLSAAVSTSVNQEILGYLAQLGTDRLNPVELSAWIQEKADSTIDSVYLLTLGEDTPYLYTLASNERATRSSHYLTLRKENWNGTPIGDKCQKLKVLW